MKILVVTAVEAERDAIVAAGCPADVVVVGVGPAESAARTSAALASGGSGSDGSGSGGSDSGGYGVVLCAGIGGGFAPLVAGDVAVASTIVFGDLGAETEEGFAPMSTLGFGGETYTVEPALSVELADRTGGHLGTIVSVATVTGSSATAESLIGRFPDAVAEGMEGAGVAAAAAAHGIAVGEIRAISNQVGPRDRGAWQIPRALESLGRAVTAVTS